MESAVGIIWRNITKIENDTDKHIAKIIYKDYQNNIFRDIDELSKNANVVPATITNFCKKNGFTGYRQLKELLKFEYDRYINKRIINDSEGDFVNKISTYKKIIDEFLDDLSDDDEFISSFRSIVLEKGNLTVFVGAQLNTSVNFLMNLLQERGIFCKKVSMGETPFDDMQKYLVEKENPYLFIFTGEDNEIMYYLYESIIDKNYNNLFFITTSGQEERISVSNRNKLVLRSKVRYFNSQYRKVISELLFLILFDNS